MASAVAIPSTDAWEQKASSNVRTNGFAAELSAARLAPWRLASQSSIQRPLSSSDVPQLQPLHVFQPTHLHTLSNTAPKSSKSACGSTAGGGRKLCGPLKTHPGTRYEIMAAAVLSWSKRQHKSKRCSPESTSRLRSSVSPASRALAT